jgi:uncharacterized protein
MPSSTSESIISTLQTLKPRLAEEYQITRIGILGSVIKRAWIDESDIDILVEFSDPPGLFMFMEIEEVLSDILHARVDLMDAKGIKPRLRNCILSEVRYL